MYLALNSSGTAHPFCIFIHSSMVLLFYLVKTITTNGRMIFTEVCHNLNLDTVWVFQWNLICHGRRIVIKKEKVLCECYYFHDIKVQLFSKYCKPSYYLLRCDLLGECSINWIQYTWVLMFQVNNKLKRSLPNWCINMIKKYIYENKHFTLQFTCINTSG